MSMSSRPFCSFERNVFSDGVKHFKRFLTKSSNLQNVVRHCGFLCCVLDVDVSLAHLKLDFLCINIISLIIILLVVTISIIVIIIKINKFFTFSNDRSIGVYPLDQNVPRIVHL